MLAFIVLLLSTNFTVLEQPNVELNFVSKIMYLNRRVNYSLFRLRET